MIKEKGERVSLESDGVLYLYEDMKPMKPIKRVYKYKNRKYTREHDVTLWSRELGDILKGKPNSKLRHKTYLSDYLYKDINRTMKVIKGNDVERTGLKNIDEILDDINHWMYRMGEPIDYKWKNIEDYRIKVVSNSGFTYIDLEVKEFISTKEIESLYKRVNELVEKDGNVEVVSEDNIRNIKEIMSEYVEEYGRYVGLFKKLSHLWKWKTEEDGIYKVKGSSLEDKVLSLLYEYEEDIINLVERDTTIRKVEGIKEDYETYIRQLGRRDMNSSSIKLKL